MIKLTLLSQITSLLPRHLFHDIVKHHQSDKYSKGIDSWTHLISMMFCQLGHTESVRDISNGLRCINGTFIIWDAARLRLNRRFPMSMHTGHTKCSRIITMHWLIILVQW